ncbi:MAG TPA: dihydrodipicolinate synthase family protein [Candidatus Sulfotelmatobacter sp.]|nr:dihydrodipicolinate synthase family protein [Candidatus Sulfotelmatobacter sp.]
MQKLIGVVPPMVTPFTRDEGVDEHNLTKLVHFLSEHVHGLFICGSYGNGPLMNVEEKKRVIDVVAKTVPARIQLVVHVGATNVRDAVELARYAEGKGAAKVSSVLPYYFHHTRDSIKLYFERLVRAVKIPVYAYNNPKFTGVPMDVPLVQELADLGVAGIKDSSFDIMMLANFVRKIRQPDFDVVLGTEAMFLYAATIGVQAFIPGLGNAFPEICVDLYDAATQGELERARALQEQVNELRDIMYLAKSTVVAVYALLKLRGVCDAYPREPFIPLGDKELGAMREELQAKGFLK